MPRCTRWLAVRLYLARPCHCLGLLLRRTAAAPMRNSMLVTCDECTGRIKNVKHVVPQTRNLAHGATQVAACKLQLAASNCTSSPLADIAQPLPLQTLHILTPCRFCIASPLADFAQPLPLQILHSLFPCRLCTASHPADFAVLTILCLSCPG